MKNTKRLKAFFALGLAATLACISIAAPVSATKDICNQSNVPQEVLDASGCSGSNSTSFDSAIVSILNVIIGVAGIVAVIFIVIGGINYMTSGGDNTKVEKGKKTILYAVIGLVICALSFAIVNWVIRGALGQGNNAPSTSLIDESNSLLHKS